MNLEVVWHPAIELIDGSESGLIYAAEGIEEWLGYPGVYMFCRIYADLLCPIYIGRSKNVGKRIDQHLNSTKMMIALRNSPQGKKVLVIGEFKVKQGQNIEIGLKLIEKTLIEYSLAEGYELTNKSGTKTPTHQISYTGFGIAKKFSGATMYVKAKP